MHDPADALNENAAWYWLAHESGVGLRRAKTLCVARPTPFALSQMLAQPGDAWGAAIGLTAAETEAAQTKRERLPAVREQLASWAQNGIGILRLDEPGYPLTLRSHLRAEQQPLFLFFRGEGGLLEMPTVLALSGDAPDEPAISWTTDTLLALASEGALPLVIARPGMDTTVARALLAAQSPLALVLAQGLGEYAPPPALNEAMTQGRAVVLSPFRPDQRPSGEPNALLAHAAAFAQGLANALLIVTPPHPAGLTPEQPCFLRPGIPKTVGCQTYYEDPEQVFLQLAEVTRAADEANQPLPPSAPLPEPPPPPLDSEDLIRRLSELGAVPEALKQRLRQRGA